ncbi:TPA: YopX family protein [Campylobacter jejuni]
MKLKDFDFRIWDNIEKKYIKTPHGLYIENTEHNDASNCNRIIANYEQRAFYIDYPFNDRNNEYYDNENVFSIELFTGYFDKNGNKIYENDILMNELTEEIFYITRDDTYKMSEIILYGKDYNGNLYRKRNSGGINLLKMLVSDKNMSVVGNIHENPELLEEGKQWKLANL